MDIIKWLIQLKGIAQKTANKLKYLANKTYPVVSENSVEVEQVQYYAQRLINLNEQRKTLISRMVKLAKSLPNHDLENLESIPALLRLPLLES